MIDFDMYVYFIFYPETWLSYVRSSFAPHQTWVLCIHLPSVILNGFLTFTLGGATRAIRLGCICIILAKAKVSSSPVTTPPLFNELVFVWGVKTLSPAFL